MGLRIGSLCTMKTIADKGAESKTRGQQIEETLRGCGLLSDPREAGATLASMLHMGQNATEFGDWHFETKK